MVDVSRRVDKVEEVIIQSVVHALTQDELEELVTLCQQEPPDILRLTKLVNTGWLRSLGLLGSTKTPEV